MTGVTPSGSGCQPSASAAAASSQSGIPNALFLLWASQGEYSDRTEWAVALYTDQAAGEADAKLGEALHREIQVRSAFDYAKRERLLKNSEEGKQLRLIMGQDEVSFYDDLSLYCAAVTVRPASAIEAATAGETGTGSTEGESAVPKADAQTPSPTQ